MARLQARTFNGYKKEREELDTSKSYLFESNINNTPIKKSETKVITKTEYVTVYKDNPAKDREIEKLKTQIYMLEDKIKEQNKPKKSSPIKTTTLSLAKIIGFLFLMLTAFGMGLSSRTDEVENIKAEYEYKIEKLNNSITKLKAEKTEKDEKIKDVELDVEYYRSRYNELLSESLRKEQEAKSKEQSNNATKAASSSNGNSSSNNQSNNNSDWDQARENVTTNQLTKAKVYWTSGGKSYHSRKSCPTLSRSKNINYGNNCPKSDPCNICN